MDTVCAPSFALSAPTGQIRRRGVEGVYVADRRVLCDLEVDVAGAELVSIHHELVGVSGARFLSAARGLGDGGADVSVTLERHREQTAAGLTERIALRSYAREVVTTTVRLRIGADFAELSAVRGGDPGPPLPPARTTVDGLQVTAPDGASSSVRLSPAPASTSDGWLEWPVTLTRGELFEVEVSVQVTDVAPAPVLTGGHRPVLQTGRLTAADARLVTLFERSVADLQALQLADPQAPADVFLGAGAPWYLTLFGRDALWAARLALPLGTELAGGTLRTLARRQGTRADPDTAEEPGKILHELRRSGFKVGDLSLPPLYYGTVDATPLWVSLLHDAWRWGLPENQVRTLLPHLERALDWMAGAQSAAGFVTYHNQTAGGLSNQGWKDSADAVQFRDGELAEGPLALCEVQAYAFAAAQHGAVLLDHFGRPGADRWRDWASELRNRFRAAFWVADPEGAYPAIALTGDGSRVDTVTSNLGHLLGTGLLDDDETALVVARLGSPELDSGLGLRTMSTRSVGYNPMSYHAGSVWTHDTGITIAGLIRVGTPAADRVAAALIEGLLRVSTHVQGRMPELYGSAATPSGPFPYPASCRPQAWAAATAVALLTAVLGLDVDLPNGTVSVAPLAASGIDRLSWQGLTLAGRTVDLDLDAGQVIVTGDLAGLELLDRRRPT